MNYLKIPNRDYDRLLNDPQICQMNIINFITYLRNKKSSPSSINLYVSAIQKFYVMNDVMLNWRKIKSFEPEPQKVVEDRPYDHLEISTLIHGMPLRNRAIVLLMASSGLRVGAIPSLRLKDLEPIDKYNIYKFIVYALSRQNYFSFCTPEARSEIDKYLELRRRWGERLNDNSPLFRTEATKFKPISIHVISDLVHTALIKTGLLTLSTDPYGRNSVMQYHGFRRVFCLY